MQIVRKAISVLTLFSCVEMISLSPPYSFWGRYLTLAESLRNFVCVLSLIKVLK